MSEHESSYTNDCTNTRRCVTGDAEVQALRAALAEAREGIDALAESNRILASQADEAEALRAALAEARRERDEAAAAMRERAATLIETAARGMRDESSGDPLGARLIKLVVGYADDFAAAIRALPVDSALGRPAPDGEPHSATWPAFCAFLIARASSRFSRLAFCFSGEATRPPRDPRQTGQ